MNEFVPVLYTNAEPESNQAKRILEEAHISFRAILVSNPSADNDYAVPRLFTDKGVFPGIELIKWFAKAYGER